MPLIEQRVTEPTEVIERGKIIVLQPHSEEYYCCSLCGYWKIKSIFAPEGIINKTNCDSCYRSPSMDAIKVEYQAIENDFNTKILRAKHEKKMKEQWELKQNSISVADMIKALKKLPKDALLVVKQEGYYAEGKYADIFLPQKETDTVYSIGHSCQNY